VSKRSWTVGVLQDPIPTRLMVAWAGLWCHELFRVPAVLGLTVDGALPFLAVGAALAAWRHRPSFLLVGYAALQVVGAIITVLPLPFLPFYPEQTLAHYVAHGVYAAAQTPLLMILRSRTDVQPRNRVRGCRVARSGIPGSPFP
jgi:hypothetical protein